LDKLESSFCIDMESVHAVGFSSGGWFVLQVGVNQQVAHRFKSIVAFAGVPFRGFNIPPAFKHGSRFVGVYGRGDLIVPGFPNSPRDPTEAVAATGFFFSTWSNMSLLWAETMGCGALKKSSGLRPSSDVLECFDYNCPAGGVSVCLWDGPHAVAPGALSVAWQVFFPDVAQLAASPAPRIGVRFDDSLLACCAGGFLVVILLVNLASNCSKPRVEMAAPLLGESVVLLTWGQ